MLFKRTLAATAIVLGTAFAANAADIPVVVAPPPAPPPAPMAPAADWTGAYFGGFGVATFAPAVELSFPGSPFYSAGTVGGYDLQLGPAVVGVNFRGSWTWGPGIISVEGGVRAGFLVMDNLLIYANGALGLTMSIGPYWAYGAGVEFALTDAAHLFAEVRRTFGPGVTTSVVIGLTLR